MNIYQKYIIILFDRLLCSLTLIVLSTVFLLTAIAINISNPDSVYTFKNCCYSRSIINSKRSYDEKVGVDRRGRIWKRGSFNY